MLIIDKNKDYYDYLSHAYGIDTKVVFDRRGSIILTNESIINQLVDNRTYYFYNRYGDRNLYFVLEAGRVQYLLKVSECKFDRNSFGEILVTEYTIGIEHTFLENTNFFGKPLTLKGVNVTERWDRKQRKYSIAISNFRETCSVKENTFVDIDHPILTKTKIPALIPAFDIWTDVANYISSLKNDRDADIVNSDSAKIVNHGFDLKTSFRHPVK